MAVKIRLRRCGEKNTPFFRVVVTDMRAPQKGRFIENVGWYDPARRKGERFRLDAGRLAFWESNGAQLSDTVRSLQRQSRRQGAAAAPAAVDAEAAESIPLSPQKISAADGAAVEEAPAKPAAEGDEPTAPTTDVS